MLHQVLYKHSHSIANLGEQTRVWFGVSILWAIDVIFYASQLKFQIRSNQLNGFALIHRIEPCQQEPRWYISRSYTIALWTCPRSLSSLPPVVYPEFVNTCCLPVSSFSLSCAMGNRARTLPGFLDTSKAVPFAQHRRVVLF